MPKNLPKTEGQPYTFQAFPAWCIGPDGQGAVFDSEGEVPSGWKMPDGKTKGGKTEKPAAPVAETVDAPTPLPDNPEIAGGQTEGEEGPTEGEEGPAEVDGAGVAWNPDLHAATKNKTKAGLWRMKVGVTRPDGHDKVLDL